MGRGRALGAGTLAAMSKKKRQRRKTADGAPKAPKKQKIAFVARPFEGIAGEEDLVVPVSRRQRLLVADGESVRPGDALTEGPVDPKKVLRLQSVSVA